MNIRRCVKLCVLAIIFACSAAAHVSAQTTALELKKGKVIVADQLTDADGLDTVRNQFCKVYTIKLKAAKTYQIDMKTTDGRELDPFLRVEDDNGRELASDDDSGGNLNARIMFKCPEDGSYRIIATTFKGGTGVFGLTVKNVQPPKIAKLVLKEGMAEVEAKLTKDDAGDRVRANSSCKIYAITLAAGKTYQIDMMSTDIDAYLRLEDSAGKELAKDDDSGGNLNARIVFDCTEAGSYRIIATTFGGGVGPFTLRVTEK